MNADPNVPTWLAEGADKRTRVRRMFAALAPRYDLFNSVVSLRRHYTWRAMAVRKLDLKPGDRVLDLCCGTGDFFGPLQKALGGSGHVVGLDFCLPMLDLAAKKHGKDTSLLLGDACEMPVQTGAFDAITVGWGLRNVPDLDAALREMARVLKPGGRMTALDMARPKGITRGVKEKLVRAVTPFLGRLFGNRDAYVYLVKSTEHFVSREQMAELLQQAGFVDVRTTDLALGNVCLYWCTRGGRS